MYLPSKYPQVGSIDMKVRPMLWCSPAW
jgi:hypothetical protein